MYRPKDWKNPFLYFGTPHTEFDLASNEHREIHEAGADAMLEALFKMAKESPTGTFTVDSREYHIYCEE